MLPARRLMPAALLAAALAPAAAHPGEVLPGQPVPDHAFPDLRGHDGRTTLAALRGQPVLVADWRPSVGETALARAAALQKKHAAAGLVVILASGDFPGAEGWAKARAYLRDRHGVAEAWTCANTILPVRYEGGNESGRIAVVACDGTLLVAGIARALGSKVDDAVEGEVRRRRAGWGATPAAKAARAAAFGRGRLGEACKSLPPEGGDDDLRAAREEIDAERRRRAAAVEHFRGRGEWSRARRLARELLDAVTGHAQWEEEAKALVAAFDAETAREELRLCEELEKTARPVLSGKGDAALAKRLDAFAESHAASSTAAYARELAALARAGDGR